LSKSRHGSGREHDRLVPRDPLFSAPCRAAGGANDAAVDAPEVRIDEPRIEMGGLQGPKDPSQGAIGIPGIEQAPDGWPRAEFVGQVPPRRTGAEDPKDAVEHHASIAGRSAGGFGFGKEILDAIPAGIGKSVTGHWYAFLGKEGKLIRPAV
jgi:hypothetical protein